MQTNTSQNFDYYNPIIYLIDKSFLICYYLRLVNIPIGIIGTLISIFIFTRPSLNKKTNTCFLFTILCFINLIRILLQAAFKNWHKFSAFTITMHFNSEDVIENIILQAFSWTQALIKHSFDRLIVVFSPIIGVRIMRKKWVLYSIVLSLFVFILCANSPFFIRNSSSFTINDITYYRDGVWNQGLSFAYEFIKIFMEVYIPYLAMVIFDVMVIVHLRRSKMNNDARQTGNRRISRFTVNTILIDLIYLIYNIPSTVIDVYLFVLIIECINGNLKFYNMDYFTLIFESIKFTKIIYNCLFFFIFLIFNKKFRSEF